MTRLVMASAGVALLAGMGPAVAQEEVSWWYESATPEQRDLIQSALVDRFEEEHSDYDVRLDYRGDQLDKQLRVAMLSGRGPDVVYAAGPSYVAPMVRADQLMPLDDYAENYGWNDRMLDVLLNMGRYDGTLYAIPVSYETMGLFFNKSLFEDNGWEVPTTVEQVEAVADKMLENDIVPFAAGNSGWRPANEWFVTIALNSIAGPEKLHAALTGEIPWTDPAIKEAITTLNEWWEKGYFGQNYFSIDDQQMTSMLSEREAGMMPSGTWSFQNTEQFFSESGDEVGFIGFPRPEGEGDAVYPLGVGATLSISANSNVPDGAAELIDFIFTTDTYSEMNSAWQGQWNLPLSDLSGVSMGDEVQPAYAEAMKSLASAVDEGDYGYTTWTFLPPATDTYLYNGIEQVWLDKVSVDEYLTNLDEEFQAEMDEGKVPSIPDR